MATVDPLQNLLLTFKFKLFFLDDPSTPIAGLTKMSAPEIETQNIAARSGDSQWNGASMVPGGHEHTAITCSQLVGVDDGRFMKWATAVVGWRSGQGGFKKANFRRDIFIHLLDLSGQTIIRNKFFEAWVSGFKAPELDASSLNTLAINEITIQYNGWEQEQK